MLLAFFGNAPMLNFYGFVPVALGGMGNNRGAVVGGLALGLFQQAANFLVGGIFAVGRGVRRVHHRPAARPEGLAGAADGAARMTDDRRTACAGRAARGVGSAQLEARCRGSCCSLVGLALPLLGERLLGRDRARAPASTGCWSPGLNLVVGFAGQIAIGWVALLTLGAYTTSVLAAGNVDAGAASLSGAGDRRRASARCSASIVGLPALRLRTFYFAMTTLGFATIVTQVALAWKSVTGGGVGVPGPVFPAPFDPAWGFYYFCFGLAAICTWMTANIARSRFGRALVAIRDAEVAAEASGISKPRAAGHGVPVQRRARRRSPAGCSPRCSPTSRPTPSPSTCRCCSSSPS